jgi:(p)ppGpp synthase/HD superfamily hydrolase
MTSGDTVEMARQIAVRAHAGQTDKAGVAYITHPARVAARVAGDLDAEAVAWLHDVVEDTGRSVEELYAAGFPERVVGAVDAISQRPDEEPDTYYARVAANPLALNVKYADLADNSDPKRLSLLQPELRERLEAKYKHAHEVLDAMTASSDRSG